MTTPTPLPASHTKHLPLLTHPFPSSSLSIDLIQLSHTNQATTGTTGTTLWLGAQVMSCYLEENLGKCGRNGKRVLELGGGVGYLALVFAAKYIYNTPPPQPHPTPLLDLPPLAVSIFFFSKEQLKILIHQWEILTNSNILSLYLASTGQQVITTDIQPSLSTVLNPNIQHNTFIHAFPGKISVHHLDWIDFISPNGDIEDIDYGVGIAKGWMKGLNIEEGFDILITTDTIYHPSLLPSLLCVLRSFSLLSHHHSSTPTTPPPPPPIYIALENRDPHLITRSLDIARKLGFEMKRVGQGRVERCLAKGGWGSWLRDGKEEVEGERGDDSDKDTDREEDDEVKEKASIKPKREGREEQLDIPCKQDWQGVQIWKWRYIRGNR